LFGIENITNNNGWAMAVVGATIVFCGLVVLSLAISQIHKILNLWDDREQLLSRFKKKPSAVGDQKPEEKVYREQHLPSVDELAKAYRPLAEKLKAPFKLTQLYEIANKSDFPHPHLSIQRLQEANILVAQGDGTFIWNE
jgi:hypothetical protein